MGEIRIKRIYERPSTEDGYRILVDRLWPRGISKEKAALDEWAKDISPSTELRKEFHHDPSRMEDFQLKYTYELDHNERAEEFISNLKKQLENGNVTFLYAAKDRKVNHATILKEWALSRL